MAVNNKTSLHSTGHLAVEPVVTLFFKHFFPIRIGMLVVGLFNFIDGLFISHFVGELALGAVAVAFPIQMVIAAMAAMLSSGMATLVTRQLGAGMRKKAGLIIGHPLQIALILSIILLLLGWLYPLEIINWLSVAPIFKADAYAYLRPIVLFSFVAILLPVLGDIFRAEGQPHKLMLLMLTASGLNILLDYLFIAVFNWGVAGAAKATVVSQAVTIVLAIYMLKNTDRDTPILFTTECRAWLSILAIGTPILITQLCLGWQTAIMNIQLMKTAGENWVIAYGMLGRVLTFATLPMIAMLVTFQTICAYNLAAQKTTRVRKIVKVALGAMMLYATLLVLMLVFFASGIMAWFTEQSLLINQGQTMIKSALWGLPLIAIVLIASGFYQSIGDARRASFYSALRVIFVFTPLLLVLPVWFDLQGIFMAIVSADIIAALATCALCWLHYNKHNLSRLKGLNANQ
ncbi:MULTISPECIES: MATE family efflux transporter [unclassified Pseudoalteromonas]|uniref:MATE family efflux transporter n=1 Tax=unclassified Pseudoalteromonas TaxID=194690 RepID=UPI0020978EE3|nr:MATE family efflux transporter [Pseudoalteromonas sp. XMcav2-N]MCO7190402.1 MATE family efflux transporter [Pseudoalteromonas sp. XMcav2-N]